MSFSSVNMCRFVIAVIFIISFVGCVLAEPEKPEDKKNATTLCSNRPDFYKVKDSQANLMICFNNIVARHLNSSSVPEPYRNSTGEKDCHDVPDFGEKLISFFETVNKVCEMNLSSDIATLIKLVDFSLRNESFKKFYEDISCVKNLEANISNICVKDKVGFFNIKNEQRHTSWYDKTTLKYNVNNCGMSTQVKNCTEVFLNTCRHDTRKYFASLFEYARDLGNCTQIESEAPTIPPADGKGPTVQAASVMTTAVIITISIGSLVVAAAIIIIIILKIKNK